MKAFCASLLTVLLAALPLVASPANTDKTLQNVKGQVTYGASSQPTTPLAVKAYTPLNDNDFAATGANSQAIITLPDSSQILMASNANVQMVSFSQTDIAHARFVVVGKMRFTVNHPAGANADYHFQTTTGEIAVRGTVGDIAANPGGLQVNVYALSNPALPVQVTLVNGQVFTLAAGQSLVATAVAGGAVTASVGAVTQSSLTPFSELGAPNAAGAGAGAAAGGATGAATGATGAASGAIAAGAVGAAAAVTAVTNTNSNTATATPSPSPAPSTTSVPITVDKHGGGVRPGARPTPSVQ